MPDPHARTGVAAGSPRGVRRAPGAPAVTRHLRSGLAGLTLPVCLCLAALAGAVPALAGTTSASTFTKTGTDPTTKSIATATSAVGKTAAGDTINWVLHYSNTTGAPALVNMTDPIGANQTFVPGSLQTPPGLSPAWSTNGGGSFASTEPGSGVNAIRAAGTSVDGSTGAQACSALPFRRLAPAPRRATGGRRCSSARTSGTSTTTPSNRTRGVTRSSTVTSRRRARSVRVIPRPDRRSRRPRARRWAPRNRRPQTIDTAFHNNGADFNGRIYFASAIAGTTNIGVSCVDTTNNTSCGYTQLGTSSFPTPAVPSASAEIAGGLRSVASTTPSARHPALPCSASTWRPTRRAPAGATPAASPA